MKDIGVPRDRIPEYVDHALTHDGRLWSADGHMHTGDAGHGTPLEGHAHADSAATGAGSRWADAA